MARGRRDRSNGDDRAGKLTDEELSSLILDDAFVRAAEVKEPAAAERDFIGPVAAPPRPPRLRLSAPPRAQGPLAWIRRRFATIVVVGLVAAMLAGSIGPFAPRSTPRDTPAGGGDNETATKPGPTSPFAGTPAARHANAAAGLVLPSASAVDGLSTAEVALALHNVRRAIEAASLDELVITDVSLAPYLDAVGPETAARLEDARQGSTVGLSLTDFVTRFHPDEAELASAGVKTAGTFRYRSAGTGVLTVEGRHVFTYAVRPPSAGGGAASPVTGHEESEVVVVRRDTEWRVTRGPDTLDPPELVASVVATSGHCLVDDGGYVWPRFTSPSSARSDGASVPVQWNMAEPLVPGTRCFAAVASHT